MKNVDYSGVYNSEITGDDKANDLHGGSGDDIIRGGLENDAMHMVAVVMISYMERLVMITFIMMVLATLFLMVEKELIQFIKTYQT